jgi:hypothetical protein
MSIPITTALIWNLEISIHWMQPIRISSATSNRKAELGKPGVYYLAIGDDATCLSPYGLETFYIGKGTRSTLARAKMHMASLTSARYANGKPVSRPGKGLISVRSRAGFLVEDVWIVVGFLPEQPTYHIGCAEELLLYTYADKNCRLPSGNRFNPNATF